MKRRPLCWICLILTIIIFLLDLRELSYEQKVPVFSSLAGKEVQICGTIENRQNSDEKSVYVIKDVYMENSKKRGQKETGKEGTDRHLIRGKVKIYLDQQQNLLLGQRCIFRGILECPEYASNPGEFDYAVYCKSQNITCVLKHSVLLKKNEHFDYLKEGARKINEWAEEKLKYYCGEEAGLFFAILMGDQSQLEQDQKTSFQRAGIYHMICISGTHLSLIGMGIYQGLLRTGAGIGCAGGISLLLVYFYGMITGAGVSLLRALVMLGVAMIGKMLGRTYDFLSAMSLSAIILMVDQPGCLLSSGFWFSFLAAAAAGELAPCLLKNWEQYCERKGYHHRQKKKLIKLLGKTLIPLICIKMTMMPVELFFSYEIPFLSMFLNLILLPTLPIVLISGFVGLVLSAWSMEWIRWVYYPGRVLLRGYLWAGQQINKLPAGTLILGRPTILKIILYYIIGLGVWWCIKQRTKRKLIPVLGVIILLEIIAYKVPSGFSVTALDIGQGDAIVIQSELGKTYLVDGGSSSKQDVGRKIIVPFLMQQGVSEVEAIFVSHTDLDHISGILELFELQRTDQTGIRVKTLYLPDWENPPDAWKELKQRAEEAGTAVILTARGDQMEERYMGKDGISIKVLYPESGKLPDDINESCMVLRLDYKGFSALLTGDIGMKTEELLKEEGELHSVQYLKIAHHGSGNSSGEDFLKLVDPDLAVISCGKKNRYGHPNKETLERLKDSGTTVFRTDLSGAIQIKVKNNHDIFVKCGK